MTAKAQTRWVWFTTARNGRRMAWEFRRRQFRAFRIPVADAELWIATGQAENVGSHPFKPRTEGT